jgi:hypothetical protein
MTWAEEVVAALARAGELPLRRPGGAAAPVVGLLTPSGGPDGDGAVEDAAGGVRVLAPGLVRDAAVYAGVLEALGCRAVWVACEADAGAPAALDGCDWVVAFECLGPPAVVRRLRALRARGRLAAVVLVPNLEAWANGGRRWQATRAALDVVTVVVAKTPGLAPWLRAVWPGPVDVVLVGHCTPVPTPVPSLAVAARTDIVHVAGCSGTKNTLENVRAGLALVRRGLLGVRRLVVCVTAKFVPLQDEDQSMTEDEDDEYALPPGALAEVRALAASNTDVVELRCGRYVPAAALAAVYARARVALCCSNAEGFGHTVLEAAAHGCLVVTTDGVPMREVLLPRRALGAGAGTVALATPVAEHVLPGGGRWYDVDAAAIVAAATAQLSAAATPDAAAQSYAWRQRCVVRGLAALVADVEGVSASDGRGRQAGRGGDM